MDDYFEIPVTYKGEEQAFTSRLLLTGYTHKIEVNVNGLLVLFEPDESQNYRAIVDEAQWSKHPKLEIGLLQAIAAVIESTRE